MKIPQFIKSSVLAFGIATAFFPAQSNAQVSVISDIEDIEAAYDFAVNIAKNDKLIQVAGLWSEFTNDTSRTNYLHALRKLRNGFDTDNIGAKALIAYCVGIQTAASIHNLSNSAKNTVVATASNGKPLTMNDYAAFAYDNALAINKGLFDGKANSANCSSAYKIYMP